MTRPGVVRKLGPAIVVAAVVLGPGSILTNSRVGAAHGYALVWLLVAAALLMAGTVALAGRLGTCLEGSLGDELARRLGRPVAALVGSVAFVIVACYQVSNDAAVLAALQPLFGEEVGSTFRIGLLVGLNAAVVAALYGLRHLYRHVERLMKLLVGVMVLGFATNLWFARPDLGALFRGLVPSWPEHADLLPTLALVATTFSIAGACYQAYLVREKGWTVADHKAGLLDPLLGIAMLGLVSLVIMTTAAATLHGQVDPTALRSATDVAVQLEPLYGTSARILFGLGIFAGAVSSFLVNAMIAGVFLADGLGLGSRMDQPAPRAFTVLALLLGLGAGIAAELSGAGIVEVIFVAQSASVVGGPLLALTLLYLATRGDLSAERRVPGWMRVCALLAVAASLVLAGRTASLLLGS